MASLDKLMAGLTGQLDAGETVTMHLQGGYQPGGEGIRQAVIALTSNGRLVVYANRFLGFFFESVLIKNVTSVEHGTGKGGNWARFISSGNRIDLKWIADQQGLNRMVQLVQAGAAAPAASPSQGAVEDPAEMLRKLAELHAAGVVTDEEFAAKKADLLRRM